MLSILLYVLNNIQIALGNKKDKKDTFTSIISHAFLPSIWKTDIRMY
jgi:hypothetical protein